MIKPGEIQKKAREVGVRDQQIEKDYILSWILQGISQHASLSTSIVFKGGTVLKKVYFQAYRFSEDLDFTLLNSDLPPKQIFEWLSEVFEIIRNEANIPLEMIESDSAQKDQADGGIHFYISYIGPLGGLGANKRVKVDISRSEKLVFEPAMKHVFLDYTDQKAHQLLCYPLEEILVEKMRSVMQRMQARDLYDIWYLLEVHKMQIDFFLTEFKVKCESKGLSPAAFPGKFEQRLPQYKGRWEKSLADQIQDLPDFELVERAVMRHVKKLSL